MPSPSIGSFPPARRLAAALLGASLVLAPAFAGAQDRPAAPTAETTTRSAAPTIVLVHGAFVDASIWSGVATRLMSDGYRVRAVQLPLTSLAEDTRATRQVLAAIDGPVVMVGYSWGGMPATEAGADSKVAGFVYFAAVVADAGQSLEEVFDRDAAKDLPGQAAVRVSPDGWFWLDVDGFAGALAHDAPAERTRAMSVSQKPMAVSAFADRATVAPWHEKRSWYAVSADDRIVPASLQRKIARTIGAETIELPTGHASILSRPDAAARFIETAATTLAEAARKTAAH